MTVTCKHALFIKLGQGNKWANECFSNDFVRLDYSEISHKLAHGLPENFEVVLETAIKRNLGKNLGASRNHVSQISKFYASDENDLWFTFHANRLW